MSDLRDDRPTIRPASWRVEVHSPRDLDWSISPELYALHGLEPGRGPDGLDLFIAHIHPDDADLAEKASAALRRGEAFAHRRRLVRPDGQSRDVLAVGLGEYDAAGTLVGASGYLLDVGPMVQRAVAEEMTGQLGEVVEARAIIEQAKGVLVVAYGITADHAFALLGWYSQRTNTRVRAIAARLVEGATSRVGDPADLDRILSVLLDPRCAALRDAPEGGGAQNWAAARMPPVVTVRRHRGVPVIAVTGDVDAARAAEVVPQLRDELAALPRPTQPHVLDLSGVGYLGPAAVMAVAGVAAKHLSTPADLRIVAGGARAQLVAAGLPRSRVVRRSGASESV